MVRKCTLFELVVLLAAGVLFAGCRDIGIKLPVSGTRTPAGTSAESSRAGNQAGGEVSQKEEAVSARDFDSSAEVGSIAAKDHAASRSVRRAAQAHMSRWTPVEKLTPLAGAVGVVVCEPVSANADAATADFGAGCARWLHFAVGGQGELGATPLWTAVDRARREMGRADVRLALPEAAEMAGRVGATDVALGTIAGSPAHCTLTYRLVAMPGRKALGKPLTVTGSEAQVVAQLPTLARSLSTQLGVRAPHVPPKVEMRAAELQTLGGLPWLPGAAITPAQRQFLHGLAPRSPLAGMLALRSGERSATVTAPLVDTLLAQAPDNALVFGEVGWQAAALLEKHAGLLDKNARRFPNSYLFALCDAWRHRQDRNANAERAAAERCVRDALSNPDAWLTLGATISDEAEALRKSRTINNLTPDELAFLDKVYPQWLLAVSRATQLDPLYGKAWLRVATAASFAGDGSLADDAFWKAVRLDLDERLSVYDWGLQMYQPKWYNDPAKLMKVADLLMQEDHYGTESLRIEETATQENRNALAQHMLTQIIAKNREALQRDPANDGAHINLASALSDQGDYGDAIREYRSLLSRNPNFVPAHYELGLTYDNMNNLNAAMREYRETLRLEPNHKRAHYDLGVDLKQQGQLDAAEKELREAIRLNPDYAIAHYVLAQIYSQRGRQEDAVRECREALRSAPGYAEVYQLLCTIYGAQKRFDLSIQAGERAVLYNPQDVGSRVALSYAYGMSNKNQACAEQCRQALRLDPNNPTAHENLGDSLVALGQKQEARTEWERVLQIAPQGRDSKEAREMLAKYP